jgi:hypothetical protein
VNNNKVVDVCIHSESLAGVDTPTARLITRRREILCSCVATNTLGSQSSIRDRCLPTTKIVFYTTDVVASGVERIDSRLELGE